MAHLIFKSLIGLCNATGVNTFSIEVKTNTDQYIIEKINETFWSVDTDEQNGRINNTEVIKIDDVLSWFDNEQINLIILNKLSGEDCECMVIYKN